MPAMQTSMAEPMHVPLKLIVTGATGFVGGHVVEAALAHGHSVIAVGRNEERAARAAWASKVQFIAADIHASDFQPTTLGACDAMMHLAWPGLPNFQDSAHLDDYLPKDARFLERMISSGLSRLLVTGTCLEYGLTDGSLAETVPSAPTVPYAIAKDALRQQIEEFAPPDMTLIWARLFYMFGPGQNPKSLLAQLDQAIARGDPQFPMSKGDQLRDYLPVAEVAQRLVRLIETKAALGIYNICSGEPISIRALVESRIAALGADIKPDLGRYPVPDYEAMAFWGDGSRYRHDVETAYDK